ncbi:MAG TPA: DUF3467 domain-containing protein [Pirellulales bacterium]|nr:DUF3467 domain-containing protein [Pirellulales bacterium]
MNAPLEPTVAPDADKSTAKPAPSALRVDDSHIVASYANFCRITGTPEELIFDFGLNPHPFTASPDAIIVTQRISTNYFTAKRILHALQMTFERHEAAFGVVEPDVTRRAMDAQFPHARE